MVNFGQKKCTTEIGSETDCLLADSMVIFDIILDTAQYDNLPNLQIFRHNGFAFIYKRKTTANRNLTARSDQAYLVNMDTDEALS